MRVQTLYQTTFRRVPIQKRLASRLTKINSSQPLEEEPVPEYDARHFLNISPGEVVGNDGQYSLISKLGWGRFSTVWLARETNRFWRQRQVAIKFTNCDADQEDIDREKSLLQRLANGDSRHPGFGLVRKTIDSFEVARDDTKHLCLVYEPLRETMEVYRRRFQGGRVPIPLVKAFAKILLAGVDFLHSECGVVHTDLKLDNILMMFEDASVLQEKAGQFENAEQFFKESLNGRRIFQSQNDFGPLRSYRTLPVIADFGLAEMDIDIDAHPIQPDAYRAPEVLLGWGWSSSADIWNLGHLIWRLASGRDLFSPGHHTARGEYSAIEHLAQMLSVLGPPPAELITRRSRSKWQWSPPMLNHKGELCHNAKGFYGGPFFDETSGRFLHAPPPADSLSLEALAHNFIPDDQDHSAFIDFMTKMLAWDPAERSEASELFEHAWLNLSGPSP